MQLTHQLYNTFTGPIFERPKRHPSITKAHLTTTITSGKYMLHKWVRLNSSDLCRELECALCSSRGAVYSAVVQHYSAIVTKPQAVLDLVAMKQVRFCLPGTQKYLILNWMTRYTPNALLPQEFEQV